MKLDENYISDITYESKLQYNSEYNSNCNKNSSSRIFVLRWYFSIGPRCTRGPIYVSGCDTPPHLLIKLSLCI